MSSLDTVRLAAYLDRALSGVDGSRRSDAPPQLERIGGGQSNPTFFLDHGGRRMVLRKQPGGGGLLPSAHAVDREYPLEVPVPLARGA